MSESSVRIQTAVELKALLDYSTAARDAAAATRELADAQAALGAGGGGGGGGGGSAPPAPSMGRGAPPPPPPVHPSIMASRQAGTAVPSGAPPPPAPGHPPARPAPSGAPGGFPAISGGLGMLPDIARHGLHALIGHHVLPANMAPYIPNWSGSGDGGLQRFDDHVQAVNANQLARGARTAGAGIGAMLRPLTAGVGMLASGVTAGATAMYRAADVAMSTGLGTSVLNFPFQALETYMQLSKVLTQVNAQFREADGSATGFGNRLGYTTARAAQLAEALGSTMNTVGTRKQLIIGTGPDGQATSETRQDRYAERYLGFARATGSDPEAVLRSLGTLTSLGGNTLSTDALVQVLGAAKRQNMDKGRLNEFMGLLADSARSQFAATGDMRVGSSIAAAEFGASVYGEGSARAENDRTLAPQVNAMFESKGPMRAFMMRALGYGKPGGAVKSKRELDMLLEAGIYDDRNIKALFQGMINRGTSESGMYEAVLPFFDKAWKADAFVRAFGTQEKLDKYLNRGTSDEQYAGIQELMSGMSPEEWGQIVDREAKGEDLMTILGQRKISMGEGVDLRREGWFLNAGGEIAKAMPDLMNTVGNVGKIVEGILTLLGAGDYGNKLQSIVENTAGLTGAAASNIQRVNKGGVQELIKINQENWGALLGVGEEQSTPTGAGSGGR